MADTQSSEDFLEELDREYGAGSQNTPEGPMSNTLPTNPMAGVMIGHDEEIGGAMELDRADSDSLLGKEAESKQEEKPIDMWCGCLSLAFYQRYFRVDTIDVFRRLKSPMLFFLPKSKDFLDEEIADNPDFYGPFWVTTTLIFILSCTTNLSSWSFSSANDNWSYDMTKVVTCVSLIYGFATFIPVLCWMTFRQLAIDIKFEQMICVYGYSLTMFAPATLLCIIPSNIAIWILLVLAGVSSSVFLSRTLISRIQEKCPQHAMKVLCAIGSTNLVLCLVIKLVFFGH